MFLLLLLQEFAMSSEYPLILLSIIFFQSLIPGSLLQAPGSAARFVLYRLALPSHPASHGLPRFGERSGRRGTLKLCRLLILQQEMSVALKENA